jgi:membrane dipeptidase
MSDPIIVDGLDCSVPSPSYLAKLRKAHVGCMHLTIEDMPGEDCAQTFEFVSRCLDALDGQMQLARSVAEIRAFNHLGNIALVLGWQAADPFQRPAETLPRYHALGLRIIGIAYNVMNAYGGGCLQPTQGLTAAGRELVQQVNELKLLLDVGGHTGEASSLEAIALSCGRPVICSHTALRSLNPNPRSTSDRVCKAIAATGGVVGVLAVSDLLVRSGENAGPAATPQAPLAVLLDHIDYLKDIVGEDHIGLGPDFVEGQDSSAPGAYEGNLWTPDMFSPGDDLIYVSDFESIDCLANVRNRLEARGWSGRSIDKLFGENWLRVYEAAWGA